MSGRPRGVRDDPSSRTCSSPGPPTGRGAHTVATFCLPTPRGFRAAQSRVRRASASGPRQVPQAVPTSRRTRGHDCTITPSRHPEFRNSGGEGSSAPDNPLSRLECLCAVASSPPFSPPVLPPQRASPACQRLSGCEHPRPAEVRRARRLLQRRVRHLPPDPTAPPQCLRSTVNYPHLIAERSARSSPTSPAAARRPSDYSTASTRASRRSSTRCRRTPSWSP